MGKPWLLLDCPYLCHRAHHAFGDLSHDDIPTAVVYGFLKDIASFMDEFSTDRVVFAFDCGYGKRRDLLPTYKGSREKAHEQDTEEEQQARAVFQRQVRRLREVYLTKLGYRNVFFQEGYEADDVIASICKRTLKEGDEAIIIGTDQDLWQLISPTVSCYSPSSRKLLGRDEFIQRWGIEPCLWANVKALAGCNTDDVPGLRGIGEVTAVKWFQGKLKPDSVAYRKINTEGVEVHNRNIKLVLLPFDGCETFAFSEDCVTPERWSELADKLGMKSLRDAMPGLPKGIKNRTPRRSGVGFGF